MAARRVLVTGCSSGIGLAVAARLARDELRRFKGQPFNLLDQKKSAVIRVQTRLHLHLPPLFIVSPPPEAVVATMRDLGKRGPLEKAAGDSLNETLEIKQLDACCEASIKECVDSLPDRRVDVLGTPLLTLILSELKISIHTHITT